MNEKIAELIKRNRLVAAERKRFSLSYFTRLSEVQQPSFLWIGCIDSRVAPERITGSRPGTMLVYRNIANIVTLDDSGILSAIDFSLNAMQIKDIVVCGHYNCGGVKAAISSSEGLGTHLPIWLEPIRNVYREYETFLKQQPDPRSMQDKLSELCVMQSVKILASCDAIRKLSASERENLHIHGLMYNLRTGFLHSVASMRWIDNQSVLENNILRP